MSTYMPKAGDITRSWYVLDAEGKTLGSIAAEAAHLLRGKHKPTFAQTAPLKNVRRTNINSTAIPPHKN